MSDIFVRQRGLIIPPRVAARPPPWVGYHDEFPSLKGMNTPTGLVIDPLQGWAEWKRSYSEGSALCVAATLGWFIHPLLEKETLHWRNLKDSL